VSSWSVGSITVTRVEDPGFELLLPSDEPTTDALRRAPWLQPRFVTDDWALRVGSSATVIEQGDSVVLVDPFLAFDDPERLGPRLQALREAGVEAEDVDVVVLSHVDGLGVSLLRDGSPTFARARYLVPRAELEAIRAGEHSQSDYSVLVDLHDAGAIEATEGDEEVVPGVRLADAPGHNPGHHVVWVDDGDASAVVVGHLFLHPAQIASPEVSNLDRDPVVLTATRRSLLERCVDRDTLLVGPLFASPGAGYVRPEGSTWRLEA
jgi:glyoxylase-like metal-dependent hydrolase (beta-lactamase superfamily II)